MTAKVKLSLPRPNLDGSSDRIVTKSRCSDKKLSQAIVNKNKNNVDSIAHLTLLTASLCAWNMVTLFMLACQYLM